MQIHPDLPADLSNNRSKAGCRSVSITIDLSAISANLATARRLSGGTKLFATVKADAYGHGAVQVATALSAAESMHSISQGSSQPIDHCAVSKDGYADGFAVVTIDEAIELRQAGIAQPILVLQGPQARDDCDELVHYKLWPVIHDRHQLSWFNQNKNVSKLDSWLKVDSGMGRLGVLPAEAELILAKTSQIRWRGLLTHFACADETENPYTEKQIDTFFGIHTTRKLERSLANSAAVLAWPRAHADWSRPGIMLYGHNPLDRPLPDGVKLHPAMSVRAPLISVKHLPAGSGIGYGQSWHCPEDMPIGYVALGYRDGLPRVLAEGATVTIGGVVCPIVGRVSMDSVAVDLRQCPSVEPGAMAEFWGSDTPIDTLAKAAGTINYELLTAIRGQMEYVSSTVS
ncbi:MAG: alanine racemase [Granulosicoccus sp.]|nr:alanine racemase [Granulosicoccus sp.]